MFRHRLDKLESQAPPVRNTSEPIDEGITSDELVELARNLTCAELEKLEECWGDDAKVVAILESGLERRQRLEERIQAARDRGIEPVKANSLFDHRHKAFIVEHGVMIPCERIAFDAVMRSYESWPPPEAEGNADYQFIMGLLRECDDRLRVQWPWIKRPQR